MKITIERNFDEQYSGASEKHITCIPTLSPVGGLNYEIEFVLTTPIGTTFPDTLEARELVGKYINQSLQLASMNLRAALLAAGVPEEV